MSSSSGRLPPRTELLVGGLLLALSVFHIYTAGFGLLREDLHRGVHLAFVIGLIFLGFGFSRTKDAAPRRSTGIAPGGVPLLDWIAAAAAAVRRSTSPTSSTISPSASATRGRPTC